MIEMIEVDKEKAPAGRQGQGADISTLGAAICLDCNRFSIPIQINIDWDLIKAELELRKIMADIETLGARL